MITTIQRRDNILTTGNGAALWNKVALYLKSALVILPAVIFLLVMRIFRPWFLIRINPLFSSRLGHFGANTELYLCERDAGINVPEQHYVDLCYFNACVCNEQLAIMWRRCLRIWPEWFLRPVYWLNRHVPGGSIHMVGSNTQYDRDVNNLLEDSSPHLRFADEEEFRGKSGLRDLGIQEGSEFICLIARDSAYLGVDYHNYRDVDIQNYVLVADALADEGYYVLRMGSVVKEPINSKHPKVIDYATSSFRSDFMDIYLGAKCLFCISLASGFDAVPLIFRRPIAYVNMVPIGYFFTFLKDAVVICKKYRSVSENRFLTLNEIFNKNLGLIFYTSEYEAHGLELVENSPEEIRALALEMLERLKGTWKPGHDDEALQRRFWELYPVEMRSAENNRPLHGKVRARYGAQYLRDNREWLA